MEMGQNCSTWPAANFSGFFPIEELGKERKKREEKMRGKEKVGRFANIFNTLF